MAIERVAVVGAGTMGGGIAQAIAAAGLPVSLIDVSDEAARAGLAKVEAKLRQLVEKGKLTGGEVEALLGRIEPTGDIETTRNVDFVIEAAFEDLEIKKGLFANLDKICPERTVLATNTSALSISDLAQATTRADKVIGMHFFNPAPVMKLVEIVRGQDTSEETLETARQFARQIGKIPVDVNESPGFIVNRLLIPMINEAASLVASGVASPEDVDKAMELGAAHPMGPLALADLIGIDVCLRVLDTFHTTLDDAKYEPCPLLREMAEAGKLGRKAGRGFYDYSG